jgi:hypothetical protein
MPWILIGNLRGPPGDSGGAASIYNGPPLESPNGVQTIFTTPDDYEPTSLVVWLNGLRETYISELTDNTFEFEDAPYSTDTIEIQYIITI